MQSEILNCKEHNIKKDYLFCLDDECDHRLGCIECQFDKHKHKGNQYLLIKEFIKNDSEELQRIFDKGYLKVRSENRDQESLVELLDKRINKYLDEMEE